MPGTSFGDNARNFIRISCGHPWSGRIERAIGILGYLVKKAAG